MKNQFGVNTENSLVFYVIIYKQLAYLPCPFLLLLIFFYFLCVLITCMPKKQSPGCHKAIIWLLPSTWSGRRRWSIGFSYLRRFDLFKFATIFTSSYTTRSISRQHGYLIAFLDGKGVSGVTWIWTLMTKSGQY